MLLVGGGNGWCGRGGGVGGVVASESSRARSRGVEPVWWSGVEQAGDEFPRRPESYPRRRERGRPLEVRTTSYDHHPRPRSPGRAPALRGPRRGGCWSVKLDKRKVWFSPSDRAFLAALLHRLPLDVLRRPATAARSAGHRAALAPRPGRTPPHCRVTPETTGTPAHRAVHPRPHPAPGTGESQLGLRRRKATSGARPHGRRSLAPKEPHPGDL
jgi:hypothetical protein